MAFRFGFYNAIDHDRRYNAEQISAIFDGLITDGVYDSKGELLATVPGEGMQVIVKTGKAWFNQTWNENDSYLPLTIQAADPSRPRFDAVVLEVQGNPVRTNSIKIIKGDPLTNPQKPALVNTDVIHQHALAYVKVRAGATSILPSDIEIRVGHSDCPFVTSIVETTNIDDLFQNWEGQFDEWFENLKLQMTDNVVLNLQRQIDLKLNIADKATAAEAQTGTNDTKYMTPIKTKQAIKNNIAVVDNVVPYSRVNIEEDFSEQQLLSYCGYGGSNFRTVMEFDDYFVVGTSDANGRYAGSSGNESERLYSIKNSYVFVYDKIRLNTFLINISFQNHSVNSQYQTDTYVPLENSTSYNQFNCMYYKSEDTNEVMVRFVNRYTDYYSVIVNLETATFSRITNTDFAQYKNNVNIRFNSKYIVVSDPSYAHVTVVTRATNSTRHFNIPQNHRGETTLDAFICLDNDILIGVKSSTRTGDNPDITIINTSNGLSTTFAFPGAQYNSGGSSFYRNINVLPTGDGQYLLLVFKWNRNFKFIRLNKSTIFNTTSVSFEKDVSINTATNDPVLDNQEIFLNGYVYRGGVNETKIVDGRILYVLYSGVILVDSFLNILYLPIEYRTRDTTGKDLMRAIFFSYSNNRLGFVFQRLAHWPSDGNAEMRLSEIVPMIYHIPGPDNKFLYLEPDPISELVITRHELLSKAYIQPMLIMSRNSARFLNLLNQCFEDYAPTTYRNQFIHGPYVRVDYDLSLRKIAGMALN